MDRRDFVKYSALAGLGLASTKLYAINGSITNPMDNQLFCQRLSSKLTVIYDVDILYIGGSSAAVASAVAASKKGAKTCVISSDPYLGDDICGTLRFWDLLNSAKHPFSKNLLLNGGLPTPMHVKRTLDNELIENDVPFLMSSFISNIFYDENNNIAGVAIANRSGEQIIRTKIIVDATPFASVVKMAGVKINSPKDTKREFLFTVLGNTPSNAVKHKVHPTKMITEKAEYSAVEYSIEIANVGNTMADYAKAEQIIRGKVWDANQVDAADTLFEIPKSTLVTTLVESDNTAISNLKMECFQSKENKQLYVLNGFAGLSQRKKTELLIPDNLIVVGEKMGNSLAEIAQTISKKSLVGKNKNQTKIVQNSQVKIYLEEMREIHTLEQLEISSETLPVIGTYDTVIAGGGTAGAPAGIAAARYNDKTLVLEYLHGLGGIGTMGLIGRYWHGYREGFTAEVDAEVRKMASPEHPRQIERKADWVIEWKAEWYRQEIIKAKGDIWFGTIVCGAVVDGNNVKGVVVATPFGKGVVLAKKVIDATGSADVAIAAGAQYEYVDAASVAVQGSGLPAVNPGDHYKNSDWTFINDNDIFDVTQTFVTGKTKYENTYDIGKLPQTRERRRIVGDFKIMALDMMNDRKYPDTISVHVSSFDSHGFIIDPYFSIKPPAGASVDMFAKVPLRALLPKGLENILVTGLGASAHRDAMPVIRMQPCLQNQGYSVGILSAMTNQENVTYRQIDIKKVQAELVKIGTLPNEVLTWVDTFPPTEEQVNQALNDITSDFKQLELLLWDTQRGLQKIEQAYKSSTNPEHQLKYAYILAFYGNPIGWQDIARKINSYDNWDKGWNYTGMGQFGESGSYLDGLITALGRTKHHEVLPTIHKLANKLTISSHLSHFKSIADALGNIGDTGSAPVLASLLNMPGISGFAATTIRQAKFFTNPSATDTVIRNLNLREIFLARALFFCGDSNGLGKSILKQYSNDLRGHYALHAREILKNKSTL